MEQDNIDVKALKVPQWQCGTIFPVEGGWAFVIQSSVIQDRDEAMIRERRANMVAAMNLEFNRLGAGELYRILSEVAAPPEDLGDDMEAI